MNQRFLTTTFASGVIVFAMVFALTAPKALPQPKHQGQSVAPAAVIYADCDAVRAAGAAPLRATQPGYRPALDANMNGIACETTGTAMAPAITNTPPTAPELPQQDVAPPQPQAPNTPPPSGGDTLPALT